MVEFKSYELFLSSDFKGWAYSGSMLVSKTSHLGSNPSLPAKC